MDKRNRLTGALIGLARATFGNDDIITPSTFPVIIAGLAAKDEEIDSMLTALESEKYKIVPDCAVCQVKCGRNDDFDMCLLEAEQPQEKQMKLDILDIAQRIAVAIQKTAADHSRYNKYFTKALMIIGTQDLPRQFLQPVIEEGKEILNKLK